MVVISLLGILFILLAGSQMQRAPAQPAGPVITMGPNNFEQTHITIKQGQTITFVDDKATGSEHILVLGKKGVAQPEAGAPTFKGATGITTQPGQQWTSSPWMTPGTYYVTCTIHPTTMNLTVIVTP
jgi:plastocyanin